MRKIIFIFLFSGITILFSAGTIFSQNIQFSFDLKRGSIGLDVSRLQEFLKTMPGIYSEGLVTGYFGVLTERAVKLFQEKYGIEQIGIVGPKTRAKINSLIIPKISHQQPQPQKSFVRPEVKTVMEQKETPKQQPREAQQPMISLVDQFLALETELQNAKMRNTNLAPVHAERIEKDIARLESYGYDKSKITNLRQLVRELTPDRKDGSPRQEAEKPKQDQIMPSREIQLRIAESQPWIFDAVTQPVPPGASQTRLTTLPAPHSKILLRHLGAFGAHIGGHPEGLDHEWIDIEEGTPVGSWADGKVIEVKLNNPSDPGGEWRIVIDYGNGLFGEHMDVKTPLINAGETIKAGQATAIGLVVPWIKGRHSGEFNLTDEYRRDGVKSWVRPTGVFVSPYDYLRDDVKKEFIDVFTRTVLEPFTAKGDTTGGVKPWEPYLTNPMLFHKMYKGALAGEWFLKSKKWTVDTTPDLIVFLTNNTKYYNKQRVMANESEGEGSFSGTWDADYAKKQFVITTEDAGPYYGIGILYYGIFELDESGPRATLKIEYQKNSYPTSFSDKANTYIERDGVGRRQDGYNLGVRDTWY